MPREYQDYKFYRAILSERYPGRLALHPEEIAPLLCLKRRAVYNRFPGKFVDNSMYLDDLARLLCDEEKAKAGKKKPVKIQNKGNDWERVLEELKEMFPGRVELRARTEIAAALGIQPNTIYKRFPGMIYNGAIGIVPLARAMHAQKMKERQMIHEKNRTAYQKAG